MSLNKNGNESEASKPETDIWVKSVCRRVLDGMTTHYDEELAALLRDIHARAKREGYLPTQVTQATVGMQNAQGALIMTTLTVTVASVEFIEQQRRMQQLAGAPGPRRVS